MAVIGVKSITGITSITNAAGGADVLTFHSNNTTERVRITSAGKVCINNDTALSDLHVCTAGSSEEDGTLRVGGTNSELGLVLDYDQSGATVSKITANPTYNNNNSLLKICVDGDANPNQLVLMGSGKIGIGIVDNTGATLQVRDGSSGSGTIRLGGSNSNGIGMDAIYSNSGATSTIFRQNYRQTNAGALMEFDSGIFVFKAGTAGNEKLRINSNGFLGIGEDNIGCSLSVYNNNGNNIYLKNSWSGETGIGFGGSAGSNGNHSGSTAARISVEASAPGGAATGYMRFFTNIGDTLSERLRIHHNGVLSQPFGPCQVNGVASAALVNITGRQHQANNTHLQTDYKQGLSVGWYTIATCNSGRAAGRIGIRETYSSRHQACVFYAAHHYGGDVNQNCINTIFSSGRHSGNPIGAIRIKAYSTYDGAMLQVYVRDSGGGLQAFMLGDNMQDQGWIMKNWIADGTDPGGLGNYNSIQNNFSSPSSYSDMNEIQGGGASFGGRVIPGKDDQWTLGRPSYRWADVYCMNSSNQTSDESLKQDIATLTTDEMNAAKRLSALFKTYRWKDAVVEKGNEKARTHTGIIAQQVKSAMEAESLDPTKYAFYCVDEWYEDSQGTKLPLETATREGDSVEEGTNAELGGSIVVPTGFNKVTRYSVRYVELLAFISAYNEQRFTSIESRLTALESS